MEPFSTVMARAERRKGGAAALKRLLPKVLTNRQLIARGDDRYLSAMAKVINQAGFSWKVIEQKWPQFEEAFFGFDVKKLSLLSPEQWEAYTKDTRVVRNWQKIKAVMENVAFVVAESREYDGFGRFLAEWPAADQVGLMAHLKKHGSRLGGQSSQWFLRSVGKDAYIMTKDVVFALREAGLDIADNPTSKRDLIKVQALINEWHDQSGMPYAHISRVAACSVGEDYDYNLLQDQNQKHNKRLSSR